MINRLGMVQSEHKPELHDDEQCSIGVVWNGNSCYYQDASFVPQIYEAGETTFILPEGFNAVSIKLDGRMQSEMDWKGACEQASKFIEQGMKILWMLDLGLFSALPNGLLNQKQLQSLILSVDHFSELIWSVFAPHSLGVCLYKGSLDFTSTVVWDDSFIKNMQDWLQGRFNPTVEFVTPDILKSTLGGVELMQLYCSDACVGYLDLLAQYLPADVECFALVDAQEIESPLLEARLRSRERSDRIRFIVKNSQLSTYDISWENGDSPYGYVSSKLEGVAKLQNYPIGLCMPEIDRQQLSTLSSLDLNPPRIHLQNALSLQHFFVITSDFRLPAHLWEE